MKNKTSFLSVFTVLCLAACCFTACGGNNAAPQENGDVKITVTVQNPAVIQGESNAFIVETENVAEGTIISYEMNVNDGGWSEIGKSSRLVLAYRCNEVGTVSVRALCETGGKKYTADPVSFTVTESGGDVFGNSPDGDKSTSGVDLYRDNGDNPVIEHKALVKVSDEFTFFKGVKTTRFVVSADIDIISGNAGDQNPKTGLFCKAGAEMWYFAFDVKPSMSGKEVVLVNYKSSWRWPGTVYNVSSMVFRKDGERVKNKMTLIRDGETFYMLINDVCLGKITAVGFTAESVVGTYTMAQNAVYSGYSCYTGGSDEFNAALENAKNQLNK